MKILPQRTLPPHVKIDRRHNPRKAPGRFGYRAFRACLRWEFGFTCAFCLLHESDFTEYGAEGLGFMGIEHFSPVSADPEQTGSMDADRSCRCGTNECHVLPGWLEAQTLEIEI